MLFSWEGWEQFTKSHTHIPLSKFGLDYCKAKKMTKDLNTHSIQYATKIYKNQEEARFPPTQCKWDVRGFI